MRTMTTTFSLYELIENVQQAIRQLGSPKLGGTRPSDLPVQRPSAADTARHRRRGDRIGCNLLRCICRLLAQSGHSTRVAQCPLSGVKRTTFVRPELFHF